MTAPFPHHYQVSVALSEASLAEGFVDSPGSESLHVGPPPQFGGREGHHSPEDLLLAALATCHMTTLVALSRRASCPLLSYRARASATLAKTSEGLRFTSIGLRVEAVTQVGREQELQRLIERAEQYCIVSKALNLTVEVESTVGTGS